MIAKFIDDVQIASQKAAKAAEEEVREKDRLKEKFNLQSMSNEKLENQIDRQKEQFEQLTQYKDFIMKIVVVSLRNLLTYAE